MSKFTRFALIAGLGAMTAACGSGGLLNRDRPDEFAVQRQAPLVVPPDFNLRRTGTSERVELSSFK